MLSQKEQRERDRLNSVTKYRRVIGLGFILLTFWMWGKVYKTMVVEGPRWREVGRNLRPPRYVPITPTRGNIYSSDAKLLAISPPYYRIYIDFQSQSIDLLQKKELLNDRLDSLATTICSTFANQRFSKSNLLSNWRIGERGNSRHWDLLGSQLSFLEYEQLFSSPIMYVTDSRGKRHRSSIYRSLYSEKESLRQKPYGDLANSTIGNVYGTPDSMGLSLGSGGIELAYDSFLRGQPGKALTRYVGGRNTTTTLEAPQDGANVYMTLKTDLQSQVHESLKRRLSELKAQRGTAIVMEASTGRILAMANLEHQGGPDSTNYFDSYPIAFNDLMEPGSTFKVATMMALLDDGYVTPESTYDVGNGAIRYSGAEIKDGRLLKGVISYSKALALSSNIVPAMSAVKYYGDNPQRYIDKIKSFGFGDDLQLELPGYLTTRIKDTSSPEWSKLSLPWIAHGYETQIPPIMMLTFFNAIANGGTIYRPYLVDQIVSPTGEVLKKQEPIAIRKQICKETTIKDLRDMLRGVVTKGTGKVVNSPYVKICGKSGTAQIAQGKHGYRGAGKRHSVTFVSFFPYENPQYSCLVNIISPRTDLYPAGGSMAGPVVREIAEYIFLSAQRINVANIESHEEMTKKSLDYDLCAEDRFRQGEMPSFVGLSASEATHLAAMYGVLLRLEGKGRVASQSLQAGSKIAKGMSITLLLQE